jgi:hypothetical protein
MLQLLLASPFVSVMCTFIHVVTLLMYSVPCPSPRTRGIYMCMKGAAPHPRARSLVPAMATGARGDFEIGRCESDDQGLWPY